MVRHGRSQMRRIADAVMVVGELLQDMHHSHDHELWLLLVSASMQHDGI